MAMDFLCFRTSWWRFLAAVASAPTRPSPASSSGRLRVTRHAPLFHLAPRRRRRNARDRPPGSRRAPPPQSLVVKRLCRTTRPDDLLGGIEVLAGRVVEHHRSEERRVGEGARATGTAA